MGLPEPGEEDGPLDNSLFLCRVNARSIDQCRLQEVGHRLPVGVIALCLPKIPGCGVEGLVVSREVVLSEPFDVRVLLHEGLLHVEVGGGVLVDADVVGNTWLLAHL
jgi:hypothetical protein